MYASFGVPGEVAETFPPVEDTGALGCVIAGAGEDAPELIKDEV